jgi:hypothetical protein
VFREAVEDRRGEGEGEDTLTGKSLLTSASKMLVLFVMDKIVVTAVIASLIPAYFSGLFMRRGQIGLGVSVALAWLVLHSYMLFFLSRRGAVRLAVSIPATLLGLASIWMVLAATG